jgi:hypothetical protein
MQFSKFALIVGGLVSPLMALPLTAAETAAPAQTRISLVQRNSDSVVELNGKSSVRPDANTNLVRIARPGQPVREVHRFVQASKVGNVQSEAIAIAFHNKTTVEKILATNDFSVIPGGTCREKQVYNEGQSCTVDVQFKAMGPGNRAGKLSFATAESFTPELIGLQGSTYGPALAFTPAQIKTLPQSDPNGTPLLYVPGDVAVDQGDSLYFTDTSVGGIPSGTNTNSGALYKLDAGQELVQLAGQGLAKLTGGENYTANETFLSQPVGLSVSPYLDIFFAENGNNSLDEYIDGFLYASSGLGTVNPFSCTEGNPCNGGDVKLTGPYWVNTDDGENVYFDDGNFYFQFNSFENLLVALTNAGGVGLQTGQAFGMDASADLFALNQPYYGICELEGWQQSTDMPWIVAGSGPCGYAGNNVHSQSAQINDDMGGYAFDQAGDLYFSDRIDNVLRRVDNYSGQIHTVAGNFALGSGYTGDNGPSTDARLNYPTGVAVDSNGVIYTASYVAGATGVYPSVRKGSAKSEAVSPEISTGPRPQPVAVIRQIGPVGERNFATQLVGKTSPVQTVMLTNVGNDYLTVSKQILGGADPTDFVADGATTSCAWTAPLAPGQSCQLGFTFAPKAAGLRTATVTFVDNTATFQNTLLLNGEGLSVATATTTTITSPASGGSYYYESNPAIVFSVANTLSIPTIPTGTVTVTVTDTTTNTVLPAQTITLNSKGTGAATFAQPAPGNYTAVAVYNGDTVDAKSTSGTVIFNVVPVTAAVGITAPAAGTQIFYGNKVMLTAVATSKLTTPVTPTGSVTFTVKNATTNTTVSTYTATIGTGGTATETITSLLPVANYSVTAVYGGNTYNGTATSPASTFKVVPVSPTVVWAVPAAITAGTKLSSTQLDAAVTLNGVAVPGTYFYSPAVGTVMSTTGQNSLELVFTPTDTVDIDSPIYFFNTIQVNAASVRKATSTKLTTMANPARSGLPIQLKMEVAAEAGHTTPSGVVVLSEEGRELTSAKVVAGEAGLTVRGLTPGRHVLVAKYGGDVEHEGSASNPVEQMVTLTVEDPKHSQTRD